MPSTEEKLAAEKLEDRAREAAGRGLRLLQDQVKPLEDNKAAYLSWMDRFKRHAVYQSFPEWIVDFNQGRPNETARKKLPLRVQYHEKNAYEAILTLCAGHPVELELKSVSPGDGQGAFETVFNHYFEKTPDGVGQASKDFYGLSMQNTDCTLSEFITLIDSRADILGLLTNEAISEEKRVVQLMGNLLPVFQDIELIINNWPPNERTMRKCSKKLLSHAKTRKLLTLTRAGDARASARNKTYHQKSDETSSHDTSGRTWRPDKSAWIGDGKDCQQWFRFNTKNPYSGCPRRDCPYNHPAGRGGMKRQTSLNTPAQGHQGKPRPQIPKANTVKHDPIVAMCNHCGEQGTHWAAKCPVRLAEHEQGMRGGTNTANHAHTYHAFSPHASGFLDVEDDDKDVPRDLQPDHVFSASASTMFEPRPTGLAPCLSALVALLVSALLVLQGLFLRLSKTSILAVVIVLLGCYVTLAGGTTTGSTLSAAAYNGSTRHAGPSAERYEWCADTGTNRFVTNNPSDFVPGSVRHVTTVVAVGSGRVTSPACGDVFVHSPDHDVLIRCTDVLLLPDCETKLMPATPFTRAGCSITFEGNQVALKAADKSPIFSGREANGLFFFHSETIRQPDTGPTTEAPGLVESWATFFGLPMGKNGTLEGPDFAKNLLESHWALGHMSFALIRKLYGLKPGTDPECAACTMGNSRERPLSKQKKPHQRSTRPNHRVHLDIGFLKGGRCFQVVVDDWSRKTFTDVLDTKADAFQSFQAFQRRRDNDQAPWKLAVLKTDSEPLYCSTAWDNLCESEGYEREYSSRYKHGQHGVAEGSIGILGPSHRAMMIHGNAPRKDEEDSILHATVIRNNSPTKANAGWTPNEKEAGTKLAVNKRIAAASIFCLCFAHVYEQERSKNENRGVACVYLGYDERNNAFRVKEWVTGKKYWTADVTFHPNRFPYRANPQRFPDWLHQYDADAPHVTVPLSLAGPPTGTVVARQQPQRDRRPSDKAIQSAQMFVQSDPAMHAYFLHNFGPDPVTWAEAMASPYATEWIAARLDEKQSFAEHDVYDLVPRAEAGYKNIFKSRPVLKIKVHPPTVDAPHGSLDKFKFRNTIAAFKHMLKPGIDYKEKYASTVRWNSVKILFAIAVQHDLDLRLFDIKTFFLYGELSNPVYMEQPDGWDTPEFPKEEYVCRLKKSLYGLPQASHCAQQTLNRNLTEKNEFKSLDSDDCVFVAVVQPTTSAATSAVSSSMQLMTPKHDEYASMATHVDDCMSIGTGAGLDNIETTLRRKFEITVNLNPTVYAGVQIERDRPRKRLKLHQLGHVTKVLVKHDMMDCKPADTPMLPGTANALMLLPTDPPDPEANKKFQSLVGDLIWLIKTRPDLLFTVCLLSRFLRCATQQHLDIARGRPLRFLRKTMNHGLVFSPGDGEWILSGASDSDHGGDLKTARSTLGHYLRLGQFGSIVTHCGLDRKISTSTGQAETYAMQSLVKDVVWARGLLRELGVPMTGPTPLRTDNDGVLKQSTKVINHTVAKHYRIAQAYIRQHVYDETVEVRGEDTSDNEVDMFTKALLAPLFMKHSGPIMGPQSPI